MQNVKNGMPLVSIIMGAYNCADTIGKCIESIIAQTYENWEFLICDDCSTDNTLEVIQKYQKNDERIIVLRNEKNSRLAASLNKCLEYAKGKYIARMDADDESLPLRLEKQVTFLEKNNEYDAVGCARFIYNDNGNIGIRKGVAEPNIDVLLTDAPFAHPTIMMKKEIFDELEGYTVSELTMRAEDLDLWFRFYQRGCKGYNLSEPLYRYHESVDDYKKRSITAGWKTTKVFLNGYKKIGVPLYKYPLALKPLLSSLVPNKLNYIYHNR